MTQESETFHMGSCNDASGHCTVHQEAAGAADEELMRGPTLCQEEMLASKELRKKTAVRRMDTLSPPSTSTPMAIRASIHLRRKRALDLKGPVRLPGAPQLKEQLSHNLSNN